MENCRKIIAIEVKREELQQSGGTVELIPGMPESAITPTAAQKQQVLGQEEAWKVAVKLDTANW